MIPPINIYKAFLSNIATLRDAFLVVSGTAYIAGYIVWAFVAWLHKSGPLPVIDGQYFVAGFLLILLASGSIVLPIYLGGSAGRTFNKWWLARIASHKNFAIAVLLPRLIMFLAGGVYGGVGLKIMVMDWSSQNLISMLLAMIFLSSALFVIAFSTTIWDTVLGTTTLFGENAAIYTFAILILSLWIGLFIRDAYTRIPQALGGAKPQCGQLDVRRADFSIETLTALGANPDEEVARTKELDILFQSSSTVIVRGATRGYQPGDHFEIDRGGVTAIRGC